MRPLSPKQLMKPKQTQLAKERHQTPILKTQREDNPKLRIATKGKIQQTMTLVQ
jgi:hypothetical protein